MKMEKITGNDITLIETCGACPEQYDAYLNDKQVGYLRLRHGHFYVAFPDVGGKVIYKANPEGDGIFAYHEREKYLGEAKNAIAEQLNKNQ